MIPVPTIIRKNTNYDIVSKGLDFILRHLKERAKELFPRKIMTHNLGYQKEVFSKDEAMQYFAESDFIDCRIRAYPDQSELARYFGHNEIAPSLILMDIDKSRFPSTKAFDTSLSRIRKNVLEEINGIPTILWTGNGYHVIQPIEATVLENIVDLRIYEKPSEQFLRFAEYYLSSGKADNNHYNTLSFGNCLLRIPGSHNSKLVIKNNNNTDESTQVKIIQEWDGNIPHIRLLLGTFHAYLVDQRIKGLKKHAKYSMAHGYSATANKISWIERLLQTPLLDNRKFCVWRILTPYLVNVRKLSDEESLSIILEWLEKCNSVKRLSFEPKYIMKYNIRNARRIRYYPISWDALKLENSYLHNLLMLPN